LDEDQAVRLEQHLVQCEECAQEEQRIRNLLDAAVPRREWTPEPSMEDRLLREMRSHRARTQAGERTPRTRASSHWWTSVRHILRHRVPVYAAAAALVVAIASGFWLGNAAQNPADGVSPMGTAPSRIEDRDPGQEPLPDEQESLAFLRREFQRDQVLFATTPGDAISLAGVIVDSL
jgi:anti-sigma factor RsiW